MLKNVVLWAAAVTLVSGVAFARDIPTNDEECAKLKDLTATVVTAIKGADLPASIKEQMKALDDQCAAKNYDQAMTAAEKAIAAAASD